MMKGKGWMMSAKVYDRKGRRRTETIAFRLSLAERKELDDRVKLSGYQTKQDYIINSLLYQRIQAVGNPLMLTKFKLHLMKICEELERIQAVDELNDELFTPIRTMLEILESFQENEGNEKC